MFFKDSVSVRSWSRAPSGSLAKASLVGASTVNGPSAEGGGAGGVESE